MENHDRVDVGPRRFRVIARIVESDDPDHPRVRRIASDMTGNRNRYTEYRKRTSRPIAVVVLTPA